MILKIFTQPNCPKCPAAKKLQPQITQKDPQIAQKLKFEYWDVTTVDGLAEASFYTVLSTPSLILSDDKGKEIKGWRGEVPSMKNLKLKIKNAKLKLQI